MKRWLALAGLLIAVIYAGPARAQEKLTVW